MGKGAIVALGIVGVLVISFIVLFSTGVGYYNQDVSLRTTIEQKQVDNKNEFNNVVVKICQVAQVSERQLDALKDIFNSYAQARTGDGSGGSVMKWVQESVPNVDTSTMNNLQNIIVSARDAFTMRQKELLDLKREHDKLLRTFPGNIFLGFLGKKSIDVVIVTSTRTENAFATGKDDNMDVFQKKQVEASK